MPIKLKANNGNIDLKAPIKQVGGKVDSVNGMTGDVVLDIPSKTSDLVNDSGFLTEHQSLAEYAKKSELFSKDYNDLTNKPTIPSIDGLASTSYVDSKVAEIDVPTKTSDLVNDSGFLTEHQSLADYAKKSEIPDVSGFLTSIPDEYVTETELDAKGYLTQHQSLENYATKDYVSNALTPYAKTSDIPDVSKFITEIPSEYVTETELNAKGYLTEHQSLADYATKSELATKQDTLTAGNNITIENGVISATGGSGGDSYTLPVANKNTLGGVKVIHNSILSSDGGNKVLMDDNNRLFIPYASPLGDAGLAGFNPNYFDMDGLHRLSTKKATIENFGVVKPDGTTITINNGVISAAGGSGGGSGGVSGYAFSSTQTLTDVDKAHLKEIYTNKNIHMTIDYLTVVRIMPMGAKRGFIVVNTNGATSNQVLVYTVDTDSSLNVISDTFTLFMSYYLVGNSSALSGDIITSENWSQYISAGGGDWQYTSSSSESNLYNAKEMVLYWTDNSNNKHQSYLNFTANFNYEVGQTLGTGWVRQDIYLDADDTISHPYIVYNGSYFETASCTIYFILYKT